MTYDPSVFNVESLDRAKWVILNPDGVHTPEERWKIETEYLLRNIGGYLPVDGATCVDFGTGIGRLAKPLIERRNWSVLGVDISQSMRRLAVGYVNSPKFLACDPSALDTIIGFGARFDFALSIWALQHMKDVALDIARIKSALKPDGRLFVLNADRRFVPTREQWADDWIDVKALLSEALVPIRIEGVDLAVIPGPPAYWGVWEKHT